MSPFKWFLLFVVLVSAIWLWPLYLLVAFVTVSAMHGTTSPRRSRKSTHKPFKFKTAKRTVYKAPRYKAPKQHVWKKGRKLKDGHTQHMKTFAGKKYWTPKSRFRDLPD